MLKQAEWRRAVSSFRSCSGGVAALLKDSESIAKKLAREGWTLTLYDKGSRTLTMGTRASRLGGAHTSEPAEAKEIIE